MFAGRYTYFVPVISAQRSHRFLISWRYSDADNSYRRGRKRWAMGPYADRNRWAWGLRTIRAKFQIGLLTR
jgi:hypothetical protein